jgi:hypothetical protein
MFAKMLNRLGRKKWMTFTLKCNRAEAMLIELKRKGLIDDWCRTPSGQYMIQSRNIRVLWRDF